MVHSRLPPEDLREGRPLDASEFAVHLDQVREGRAPDDYQEPERFFARTYLTQNLLGLTAEVVRRLSGIKVETSPIFNMATQLGGGKTHALTLLYHLAGAGPKAADWHGVPGILQKAGVNKVPQAAVAVFVGQQFDPRGGDNGTPLRQTPRGEIAFQLGEVEAFDVVAGFDADGRAPVIHKLGGEEAIDETIRAIQDVGHAGGRSRLPHVCSGAIISMVVS